MYGEIFEPKTLDDIINYSNIKELLEKWYNNGMKKPLLFYGKPGVGKTVMAKCFAKSKNLDVYWITGKDDEIIIPKSNCSLFSKRLIVIIDELENISDKRKLFEIMEKFPCILIANDPYIPSLKNIREKCELVEFKGLYKTQIKKILKKIAEKLNKNLEEEIIDTIVEKNGKDVRASINDLLVIDSKEDAYELLGLRDTESEIFKFLGSLFKYNDYYLIMEKLNNLSIDHNLLKFWIDENIPLVYKTPEELNRAYEMLSKADIFDSRVYKKQYYKLWKYSRVLMTYGVSSSKKEETKVGFVKFRYPKYAFKKPGVKNRD